jgi:hypothetical protein
MRQRVTPAALCAALLSAVLKKPSLSHNTFRNGCFENMELHSGVVCKQGSALADWVVMVSCPQPGGAHMRTRFRKRECLGVS